MEDGERHERQPEELHGDAASLQSAVYQRDLCASFVESRRDGTSCPAASDHRRLLSRADGRRFRDIDEFKQLLLTNKDQLARALTERLVTYATGGGPTTADRPEIEAIVRRARDRDYGLRTLVHEIVQSQLFQDK